MGVTDANGTTYAVRLLETLRERRVEIHLVVAESVAAGASGAVMDLVHLADHVDRPGNLAARISSGSYLVDGMIVAPCSPAATGAMAHGLGADLIHRAADVMMKEQRPLVLLVVDDGIDPVARRNLDKLSAVPGVRVVRPEVTSEGPGDLDRTVEVLVRSVGIPSEG